jgi:hypothetical protein
VLLIADAHATGKKRRDVSQYLTIAEVFDTIVAGLADDPDLLDLDTATAGLDLSDLDLRWIYPSPNYSNLGCPGSRTIRDGSARNRSRTAPVPERNQRGFNEH